MHILEIIDSNHDLVRLIQKAVFHTLKLYGHMDIVIHPAFYKINHAHPEVIVVGMLRLNSNEEEDMLVIGFSERAFVTIYRNMFNEQVVFVTEDNQDMAGEILNIIYRTIDPVLEKYGYQPEVSLPEVLTGCELDKWINIPVNRSLVFPFATVNGNLYIEIPDLRQ